MRAKNLLLSIIAVCSAFIASAENADTCIQVQRTQEQFQKEFKEFIENTRAYMIAKMNQSRNIIPVDSTHLLNKEQKQTIKYTKKYICKKNSTLELPIEINQLLEDTITKTNYKVKPKWEEAYFIKADSAVMIVPLYNESLNLLQCQLRVENLTRNVFSQKIETLIGKSNEVTDEFTGSMVYSNYLGNLIKIYSFKNGECVEIIQNEYAGIGMSPISRSSSRNAPKTKKTAKRYQSIKDWKESSASRDYQMKPKNR